MTTIRVLLMLVVLCVPVWAAEQLDLAAPITPPSTTTYKVIFLSMQWPQGEVSITLADENGKTTGYSYNGPEATSLMQMLNTANLSVKSLQRRILEKLVNDGKLTGTVSGPP